MKELNKKNFESLGRWVAPVLAWAFGYRWAETEIMKKLGMETKSDILSLDGHAFFLKEARNKIESIVFSNTQPLNESFFKEYISLSEKTINDFLSLKRSYKNEKDVIKALSLFFNKYEELWSPWISVFFVSDAVEKEIRRLCAEKKLDADKILKNIHPKRKNFTTLAKEEMLEIRNLFAKKNNLHLLNSKNIDLIKEKDPELTKKIDIFLKNYEWIGTHHFWGEPMTKERFFDEINNINPNSKSLKNKGFSKEIDSLLEIAGNLSWIRLQCAEASDIVAYSLKPLLKKIAERLNISYYDLIWLSHIEILDSINKDKLIVSRQSIENRKKAWGAYFSPDKIEIFDSEKLNKLLKDFVKETKKSFTSLKGVSACPGKVEGKVRVALTPHLIKDFKKGEILVSPETTPDYVPLMKLASAIITDQGGVTSHAAIVSRELNVPCVIGTKYATQILKDGDLVEVDANKGVIKILKK